MGKAKKSPKFAVMKRLVSSKMIKKHKEDVLNPRKKDLEKEKLPRNVPNVSSALFFKHNSALGPPYRVLVDTNFINFSIQNKLDLEKAMMDCLYAKCTPCITDCVMAELEKLGQKYRVALRIAKDPRFERLPCSHKGTYADDCMVDRVTQHKCYIVATCDRDLKRRIRKIPGVPIMYITQHKYSIERLPEATIGGGMLGAVILLFFIFVLIPCNSWLQTSSGGSLVNVNILGIPLVAWKMPSADANG
ncbi:PIN domain [Macleaya cordata]|uniref:PIN domain n=1 Tax=Macleaya cordata TaxID=56857 RepID=A0A200PUI6_MACCD|nr:PIN domain [Macleaya cordata]